MPDVPLEFPWRVAESGYHQVDSDTAFGPERSSGRSSRTDGPVARRAFASGSIRHWRIFPGLFRVFAETEPNQDGIKAFADRFGPLGGDIAKQIPLYDQPNAEGTPMGFGESLAAWSDEILTMRFAIDMWDAARNGPSQSTRARDLLD